MASYCGILTTVIINQLRSDCGVDCSGCWCVLTSLCVYIVCVHVCDHSCLPLAGDYQACVCTCAPPCVRTCGMQASSYMYPVYYSYEQDWTVSCKKVIEQAIKSNLYIYTHTYYQDLVLIAVNVKFLQNEGCEGQISERIFCVLNCIGIGNLFL